MYRNNFLSSTWLTCIAVLLLGACSESNEPSQTDKSTSKPESGTASKAPVAAKSQPAKPAGMCSLISSEEVVAALGGKLPLGKPRSNNNSCEYPVRFGVDGNNLSYGRLSRGNYDAYKAYENQSGIEFEYIEGVGQEAFILNKAQVCVLLNDNDALIVAAMVMAMGEELPISPEELKAGLIEIAGKLIEKL